VNIDQALVDKVGAVAREAGTFLMQYWGKKLHNNDKPGAGFATEADRDTEQFIIKKLKEIDPSIPFWAEESGISQDGSDWYWVIDPLDGTTNFAHHIPYFCVSIALTYKNEPQVGAIYDPILDELFVAYKGGGAMLNGARMAVSEVSLEKCVIAVNLPYVSKDNFEDNFNQFQVIRSHAGAIRIMGSAALGLAHVAAGRFDGTFFPGLCWWDVAAGIIILKESGAIVSELDGTVVGPGYQTFLASGKPIYDKLCGLLTDKS